MEDDSIRILLVEDNPADAALFQRLLPHGLRAFAAEMRHALTLAEGLALLGSDPFDVVVLDLNLPDSTGIDGLRRLRTARPDVAIVLLSGLDDEQTALAALHEGAQDYLTKGNLTPELLAKSLQYAIERHRAERAIRASQEMERFEKAFEGSLDAIAIHRMPEGPLFEVNRGFVRLTGLSREEILGRALVELPVWKPSVVESLRQAIAGGVDVRNREVTLQHRNGTQVIALVSTADVTLGGAPCRLWFFRDVTGQRESDRAVRELSARLLQLQDEERRLLARELHDGISPPLVALTMELAALKRITGLGRAGKRVVARSLDLAKQALRDLRTASYLLHPPLLDETGLPAALRWYAQGFSERSGIRVDLTLPEDLGRLPRETETAVFRIIQESLSNVHRHSGSDHAEIRLEIQDGRLQVEVLDQGRGFGAAPSEGVGIAGMRERVRPLGGELRVGTNGDRGAAVRVVLPILEERAA